MGMATRRNVPEAGPDLTVPDPVELRELRVKRATAFAAICFMHAEDWADKTDVAAMND